MSEVKQLWQQFRAAQQTGKHSLLPGIMAQIDAALAKADKPLTEKQRKFSLAYVGEANGDGMKAAKLAGYKASSDNAFRVIASQNLDRLVVQEYIRDLQLANEKHAEMDRAECLNGYAAIARSDIANVFEIDGSFDLQKAKRRGQSKFIKSINFDKDTGRVTRLEMYSALEARRDVGKHLGLFPTRIVLSQSDADALIDQAIKEHGLPGDDATAPANDLPM